MRYNFPKLSQTNPQSISRALQVGKLSDCHMFIDLPHDFKFDDDTKPEPHQEATTKPRGKTIPLSSLGLKATVKPEPWPFWALPIKMLSKETDRGMGDTIERLIGTDNSEAFKTWWTEHFKTDCGCQKRKDWLNQKYPLEPKGAVPKLVKLATGRGEAT